MKTAAIVLGVLLLTGAQSAAPGSTVVLEDKASALCQSPEGCYLVPRDVADGFHRRLIEFQGSLLELEAANKALKEQAARKCGWPA